MVRYGVRLVLVPGIQVWYGNGVGNDGVGTLGTTFDPNNDDDNKCRSTHRKLKCPSQRERRLTEDRVVLWNPVTRWSSADGGNGEDSGLGEGRNLSRSVGSVDRRAKRKKFSQPGKGKLKGISKRFRRVGSGKRERRGKEARGEEDVKNIAGEREEDRKNANERGRVMDKPEGRGRGRGKTKIINRK